MWKRYLTAGLFLCACAKAESPPVLIDPVGSAVVDPSALPPESTVDEVLDALQARGQNLQEFSADITQTATDITMGDVSKRLGKVWYQAKPAGTARMHIVFDKAILGDKPPRDEKKEYLLDNGWAVDRDYRAKNETKYQIARPGEKMNLFQLGKGAFPLPIGQNKDDVHAMFDVSKVTPDKDDPPATIHLQLKPKSKTNFDRKFSMIAVWVNLSTKMPVRISTEDRNQTTQQQTDLQNMKVNPKPPLADADFDLPAIEDQGWNRHEEPLP